MLIMMTNGDGYYKAPVSDAIFGFAKNRTVYVLPKSFQNVTNGAVVNTSTGRRYRKIAVTCVCAVS